jgi:hypothetical protein
MRRVIEATGAVVLLTLAAVVAAAQSCPGDNNRDGAVTVDEIVASVTSALEGCPQTSERFVDNRDGTITDSDTGLMWEKHGSEPPIAPWSGFCSPEDSVVISTGDPCQPAGLSPICMAQAEGDTLACGGCLSDGECSVAETVWSRVIAVNASRLGGYNNWRLPTDDELETLVVFDGSSPATVQEFNRSSCASGCGDPEKLDCNCTSAGLYWTATTKLSRTFSAVVDFGTGGGGDLRKSRDAYVRAVRDVN